MAQLIAFWMKLKTKYNKLKSQGKSPGYLY